MSWVPENKIHVMDTIDENEKRTWLFGKTFFSTFKMFNENTPH